MGTNIQEVLDSFKIKAPLFSGDEDLFIQIMKSAIAKCYRVTYDDLLYVYDSEAKKGHFSKQISNSSVELIATFMAKEFYAMELARCTARKSYLGTQAFNKIPGNKEKFDMVMKDCQHWNEEAFKFSQQFPDYSEDR